MAVQMLHRPGERRSTHTLQADPELTRQLARAVDAFDLAQALALLAQHPDAPPAN